MICFRNVSKVSCKKEDFFFLLSTKKDHNKLVAFLMSPCPSVKTIHAMTVGVITLIFSFFLF